MKAKELTMDSKKSEMVHLMAWSMALVSSMPKSKAALS